MDPVKGGRSLERQIPERDVRLTCYGNALAAYGQSGQMAESDWMDPAPIDQRTLFEGNSVLRGQAPRVDEEAGDGGAESDALLIQ